MDFGQDQSDLAVMDRQSEAVPASPPRHSRRLSDKILVAFHHACDLMDLEVAEQLLMIVEQMTTRHPRPEDGNRRRNIQGLVSAHERLWHLRHPSQDI